MIIPFKKKTLVALVVLTTVVLVIACNWNLKTRTPPAAVETPAADFQLPDHKGNKISLDSLVQDGPAVVVFYRGHW